MLIFLWRKLCSNEQKAGKDRAPIHLGDIDALKSVIVDVRPAVDDVGSIFLRYFKMPTFVRFGMTDFKPTRLFLDYSARDVILGLPHGVSSTVVNPGKLLYNSLFTFHPPPLR